MLKILEAEQIRRIDSKTIEHKNILSIDLMEKAALAIYQRLIRQLNTKQTIYIFAGTGNNGGDALAIARMLLIQRINPLVYIVNDGKNFSSDCLENKNRLERLLPVYQISQTNEIPDIEENSIVIDGLIGSGLNRPLEGIYADTVKAINKSKSKIYSIDIPSGLFMTDNTNNVLENIVRTSKVFSFQLPKLVLLLPESKNYYQKFTLLDIGLLEQAIDEEKTDYYLTQTSDIARLLKGRNKFDHKGDFGKVLLVVGSRGKIGAAVLASKACLRTGAGLLTVHIPQCGADVMTTAIPEAMIDTDTHPDYITSIDFELNKHTIGIGCGIGTLPQTKKVLAKLIETNRKPMVLDADALNIIAEDDHLKYNIPAGSILTPHPVEFERLIGQHCRSGYERLQHARKFAQTHKVYIVLKGAYSAIITPEQKVYFNPTGNPGMATGGSGDVLTGIITSLLAQSYVPLHAALLGVYLHGLAGDIAAKANTEYSMLPSDIISNLGHAFRSIENEQQ